jgi:hypothetical protein
MSRGKSMQGFDALLPLEIARKAESIGAQKTRLDATSLASGRTSRAGTSQAGTWPTQIRYVNVQYSE